MSADHLAPVYAQWPLDIVDAEGVHLRTRDGRRILEDLSLEIAGRRLRTPLIVERRRELVPNRLERPELLGRWLGTLLLRVFLHHTVARGTWKQRVPTSIHEPCRGDFSPAARFTLH